MSAKMKLTNIDLLSLFSTPEYAEVLAEFREKKYSRKTLISTPYDQKDTIFIVKSGRLRIFLAYEDREFTLALLEPGDIFSTHSKSYVQTLEESCILTAKTRDFQSKLASHPEISSVVVQVLGELLKNSIDIIEGLAFKDVRRRFYDFLQSIARDRGVIHERGIVVELGLNTEDVALLIGTSRQTISMLLNELIRLEHVARVGRQTLLIKNLSALDVAATAERDNLS